MALSDLYQEVILDHNKNPRNKGVLDGATSHANGHNPLCGDQVEVFLIVEDGIVKRVNFDGHGCAISTASASLMTEAVTGKTLVEVDALFKQFQAMLTANGSATFEYEQLEALTGVKEFPMRVKCATLAWHTLHAAIENTPEVTTE